MSRIAYLVNRYPAVSHSFIRREIASLEEAGAVVRRFTIRGVDSSQVVDPADREEIARTRSILAAGLARLLLAGIATAMRRPLRFGVALRAAFAMAGAEPRRLGKHLAYLLEACLLAGWVRADRVAHLHAHFGTNSAAVARLVHLLTGIPYSFTVHGPEEFDSPIALRLKDKAADAQAVIAISSFGRSQLMRWLRLEDWPKIRVVRCGVDAAFLAAAQHVWANTEAFCCVARLSAQKGLPLLLDACAILAAEGRTFHLSIIGDGEMREDLEQQVARLGLASKISFLGARDAQSVRDLLAQSRFFVLPSFAEGLPVVLMEALALSKPVVTTAVAGIPELVDSACGWMVPAGDSDALARAMADALDASDEQLRLMGTEGRRRICQWHDASKNARELLLVFADRGQASERCS